MFKDVGHAILESYSRVLESLAFNIAARIEDVLYMDESVKNGEICEALIFSFQSFLNITKLFIYLGLRPCKAGLFYINEC